MKKPKTIADLKINWTFIENIKGKLIRTHISKFKELNPNLAKLKIKGIEYKFKYIDNDTEYEIVLPFRNTLTLARLISTLNYGFSILLKQEMILSSFERINDNEYIIHTTSLRSLLNCE